jgi:hypothetical protein
VNFDQADFAIRCEWGLRGLRALDVVTSRGALIYPFPTHDAAATAAFAASIPEQSYPLPGRGNGDGCTFDVTRLE